MDWNISRKKNPNVLLIVAHPDDETIFCGGTLLSFPMWNWTIVCMTMQQDTARPQEFEKAMNMYKMYGVNINSFITLEKRDVGQILTEEERKDWELSLRRLNFSPDFVISHNSQGEYGHGHHEFIHTITKKFFSNVWGFAYPQNEDNLLTMKRKVKTTSLSDKILHRKRKIFESCYTSQSPLLWSGFLKPLMEYAFTKKQETFVYF